MPHDQDIPATRFLCLRGLCGTMCTRLEPYDARIASFEAERAAIDRARAHAGCRTT